MSVKRKIRASKPAKVRTRETVAEVVANQAKLTGLVRDLTRRVSVLERWGDALEDVAVAFAPSPAEFRTRMDAELAKRGLEAVVQPEDPVVPPG